MEELRERVAELIQRREGTSRDMLLADTPFRDLGYDSLAVIEISFVLEDEFQVDLENRVSRENLPRNLTDLVSLMHAVIAEQRPGAMAA